MTRLTLLLLLAALLLLPACAAPAGQGDGASAASAPAAQGTAEALKAIQISGEELAEPKVSLPEGLNAPDESYALLRQGTGEPLTADDEAGIQIQIIPLDDQTSAASSWSAEDSSEMTIDLAESMADQMPADLRDLLLKANVGAVIAYKTTADLSSIAMDASGEDEVTAPTDGQENPTEQVWIITVISKTESAAPKS